LNGKVIIEIDINTIKHKAIVNKLAKILAWAREKFGLDSMMSVEPYDG